MADLDPVGWTRHPAMRRTAPGTALDLGMRPAPFGLPELTTSWVRWRDDDTAAAWTAAAEGMAGGPWTELRCSGGRSWRIDDAVDLGLALHLSAAGGSGVPLLADASASVGARWTFSGAWSAGCTLHDLPLMGATRTSATMGVGMQCSDAVDVSGDLSVAPPYGSAMMLAVLVRVHPLLSVRCAVRTTPMQASVAVRCSVDDVFVRCAIDAVRDLGIRTLLGVTWSW
jgi:hypothetical protein